MRASATPAPRAACPAASSSTPIALLTLIGSLSSPRSPNWSMITDIVSWPAIEAATMPPAPSVRTVISTVET